MRRLLLVVLLLCLLPGCVSAYEVTCPFGWRVHPIWGNSQYHSGVDLAGEMGDGITSVKGGVVSFAGWGGGYGNLVIIDHPDGSQTYFAHASALYVREGDPVNAGQLIAAVGSTGDSTGPHLHFEYREADQPVDPMPLLLAAGWDIMYGANLPTDEGFRDSDENILPWNFDDFYDIAKQIREILQKVSKACTDGLGYLQHDVMGLLQVVLIIDLALGFILWGLLDSGKEDWSTFLVRKVLRYGFIVYLVANWGDFVNTYILDSFTKSAVVAGGGGGYIVDNISDPSQVIQKGIRIVEPVFTFLSKFSGMQVVNNIHHILVALVLGFGILLCFILVGVQFFIAYLEFYIISLLSIVVVPFGVLKHTAFIGERGLGAVINCGIRLMCMTFLVSLVVGVTKETGIVTYDYTVYFKILMMSGLFLFFVGRVQSTVAQLLQGNPKF